MDDLELLAFSLRDQNFVFIQSNDSKYQTENCEN